MKRSPRLCVISLGCPKNLVDTEAMVGVALPRGYQLENDPEKADAFLVNTCSFIGPSREESMDTIQEVLKFKQNGRAKAVLVAGCMASSHEGLLKEQFPEVDAFLPLAVEYQIGDVLDKFFPKRKQSPDLVDPTEATMPYFRLPLTLPHTAYLRISDGCDHTCSFCIIPQFRGKHHSKSIEDNVREAKALAAQGVRELNLISQDSTAYGRDLYGNRRIKELLEALCQVDGLDWIRVFYAFPSEVTDEFIEVMAEQPKILPYLDMPLQHASERILRAMRRPHKPEHLRGLVQRLRSAIPEVSIRSTFIVGFPGETEDDFQQLMDFCQEMEFEHASSFVYSPEETSPSFELPGHVPEEVKLERQQRLNDLLTELSTKRAAEKTGQEMEVLIDAPSEIFPDYYRGRHYGQAPEIDGVVYVPLEAGEPGDLVQVKIIGNEGFDLFSE